MWLAFLARVLANGLPCCMCSTGALDLLAIARKKLTRLRTSSILTARLRATSGPGALALMIFIRSVEHPSPLYGYASNHSSWRNSTLHACTLSRFYSSAATSIVLRSIETRKTTAHAGVAARYYCLVADVWRTRCAATSR